MLLLYHIVIYTILHSGTQLLYGAKDCLIEHNNFRIVFAIGGSCNLFFRII